MDNALSKYTGQKSGEEAPIKNWAASNSEGESLHTFSGDKHALDFWKKKLEPGFIVKHGGNNQISILPNLEPVRNIYKSLIANNGSNNNIWTNASMLSQSFQSLQTAIDSQKNSVNSNVSQLLERFRQDNSTFETMIQLLTKMTEDLHRYNAGYMQ
ncbi:hypothetical protein [Yersinia massiliensis]|nr:hypothetical protein [Yersinia massiliensis]MCB5307106.1 hypothetical protein [Yersinia massiliensis]